MGSEYGSAMDLIDALRTSGAIREFRPDPVADEVISRMLDTARFAPSGGNRQGWRVIVIKDAATRRAVKDLYLPVWYEYLAQRAAGLTPWAPVTDRDAEVAAVARADETRESMAAVSAFAEHFDEVPVMIAVLADLGALAAVDRDLDRYTLVGGASIYPFVWSILLAARAEGLGGVLTTMPIRREPELRDVLGVPDRFAVAAVLALGRPVRQPSRLTREPIASFASRDRFDGPPFE